MADALTQPQFQDADKAREYLEAQVWPRGPVCPHCGGTERNTKSQAKSHRPGLYHCGDCREQFTVTVGSLFERSKVPLNKWLLAVYLLCSSKKGVSAHQLHRTLGVTYKTAWFMAHRIREAMKSDGGMFGTGGGFVEVDETFIGKDKASVPQPGRQKKGMHHKLKVLALIDRESGKARSVVVGNLKSKTLLPIIKANVAPQATLMTDEAIYYFPVGHHFAKHQQVNHSLGEYVFKHDNEIHTNTVEGFFSIFKRGMKGVYQHCGQNHLQRYLTEFDFRYNNRAKLGVNDSERANIALKGISGKRLTYRRTDAQQAS